MTSADFLAYRNTESSPRPPSVSTTTFCESLPHLPLWVNCVRASVWCATWPTQKSLLCDFCSSVPTFAVLLPSDMESLPSSLQLANWLSQLTSKGLAPSSF